MYYYVKYIYILWFELTLIASLNSLNPSPKDTLKLNIDGSFLEEFGCLGVGGVVHNHDGDWIAGFSQYEAGGDALLAELCAIQIDLDFCSKKRICQDYL